MPVQTCYPISKPTRSAAPTFEPISLDEAKAQCGLTGNGAHDQTLSDFIATAREAVEHDAMLVCCTGTYTAKRTVWGVDYFELPSSLRPVTAVTAITYVATDGTATTWSASEYAVDTYTLLPIVKLAHGYTWPSLRGDINGITITVTAGYASQALIPKRVKDAVKLHLHYEWLLKMESFKEAESAMVAYERVVNLLRQEIYA